MEWLIDIILPYAKVFSYTGIALGLLITGIGFPIPEDIILLIAGVITAQGYTNIYWMIALTMIAILGGDLLMYGLGYYFGTQICNIRPFSKVLTPQRQEKISKFYARHGKITIFAGRFAPGLRAGIYLLAGASRHLKQPTHYSSNPESSSPSATIKPDHGIKVTHFLLMDFLAALISVPFLVWVGFFFSKQVKQIASFIAQGKLIIFLIVLLIALAVIVYRRRKKRRLLLIEQGVNDATTT